MADGHGTEIMKIMENSLRWTILNGLKQSQVIELILDETTTTEYNDKQYKIYWAEGAINIEEVF